MGNLSGATDLVRGERVPYDHLAVLRRANDVPLVHGPVSAQDLALMTLENAAWFDINRPDRFETLSNR